MQRDQKIFIVVVAAFLIVVAIPFWSYTTLSHAQQQTTTTPPPPAAPSPPIIDATTGTAVAAGGAAGIIAIVKQILDQRKNKEIDKSTDRDVGVFVILISKFYQAKYLYPHMSDKQILDLPISNNPMSSKTLGQAITEEADAWAQFNQQYWNIPSPQMSVPSATTVNAVSTAKVEPNTTQQAVTTSAAATNASTDSKPT